jgi:3-oxoacyl-[acyl-carrier protein] reductase
VTALAGRAALITGASRGLGAAIARAFWTAGANLMLTARSAADLNALAGELPRRAGQQVHTLADDLADPAAPGRIGAAAQSAFPRLHILVNNAAIQGPIGSVWENDWAAWQATLRVNLLAPVDLCRRCGPGMAANGGGKIINLSGGGATGPRAGFSAYATAKAGLVRFTETLAAELKDEGVEVNAVAPGMLNTSMQAAILAAGPGRAGEREFAQARQAGDAESGSMERAAALCVFLGSPASDGITGRLLSAVWDDWEHLPERAAVLGESDVYTLRRIGPKDRGLDWP